MDKKDMPLISIIVPVYNTEKYIKRCIESLISQSYKNIEIILVDDESEDSSLLICLQYAKCDNRVVVIRNKHRGLSVARNVGKKRASGEYLVFIDSDDFVHYQMIELLYNSIIEHNADLTICNYDITYENDSQLDNEMNISQLVNNAKILTNKEAIYKLFGRDFVVFTVAWNKMYHKNLFNRIEYPEGKIHEDEFVTYQLLYRAERIAYLDVHLYYYMKRADSIMSQPFDENRYDRVEAYKQRLDFLIEKHICEKCASKWYLMAYLEYLFRYEKTFPEKELQIREYTKTFQKEFLRYRKYLELTDCIKIIFRYYCPKIYKFISNIWKGKM